ncbi:MAG: deoxyhypusine synthase [bacterium]
MSPKRNVLSRKLISPNPIHSKITIADLVDNTFLAYNAARMREGCQLFTEKMLAEDVTVGMSLSGALTAAGLGMSCIIPLIEHGFVDWIVSTGANLYHDSHFALGLSLHQGTFKANDVVLKEQGVVRIYDVFFDYDVLLSTDAFYRKVMDAPAFHKSMSTAEFHYHIGKYLYEREKKLGLKNKSLLTAAYLAGVPVYTSSPGDSSMGMNVAAKVLHGHPFQFDVSVDVNETAALVLNAKRTGGKSAVLILGGGSPKNFVLQTEPQIQEILGIDEKGHDYYLQFTDARVDTGGLSGATPSEAVSWGKVDPQRLPDAVTCYCDATIALPVLTAYALARSKPRELKQLYHKRDEVFKKLKQESSKRLPEKM